MRDFRQLTVWEQAHRLVLSIYRITAEFPKHELYGLTSQMRRCSASIAANIAEGCGRTGNGDLHRFLSTARGSAAELEYFLLLSRDLGLVRASYEELNSQTQQVERMLASLIRKVEEGRTRKQSLNSCRTVV
jgi:four helix bundle protein